MLANRREAVVEIDAMKRPAVKQVSSAFDFDVVLRPLSRPELGEIRIDDDLFAIGRTEQPFASYGTGVVNMLSRQHARVFRKDGSVYLTDLQSRNGTTVNHVGVGRAPCQLRDGDEICFGGALSYRVQITPRGRPRGSLTLTLTPKSGESGLDTIVIAKFPFLVSKTEPTFSRYKANREHGCELGYLSRRHAHIYQKDGQPYIEDLGSGNGTFIDGRRLEQAAPLQDGVVVAFGGKHFVYRVAIARECGVELAQSDARAPLMGCKPGTVVPADRGARKPAAKPKPIVAEPVLSGAPKSAVGPEANVVEPQSSARKAAAKPRPDTAEPALSAAGKVAEEAKSDVVESAQRDIAGPTTSGARPAEKAKPEFVEPPHSAANPPAGDSNPNVPPSINKTQFMAAPTSFLEILCEPDKPKDDVAADKSAVPADAPKEPSVKSRRRGRVMLFLSELASLHASGEPDRARGGWWKASAVGVALGALALTAYFLTAPERELRNAVARGEYARAAALAFRLLEKHPDDVDVKERATEAGLKANVPVWLGKVRARDFDGAKGVLTGMSELGMRDADLRPLIDELEWLGDLELLIDARGGPEAPIRIYADEDSIERLVGHWNDDTGEHQRAMARIASYVPQFGNWYGNALTHLRRLQSQSTVYLPVIVRVKATIATELGRDNPDSLEPALKDISEKYPDLGGLDSVRQDLTRYVEIREEIRNHKSGRLFALVRNARFVTPPFEQSFRTLIESGKLPPAELLQEYDAATQLWKDGNSNEALAALQKIEAGPWADDVAKELERRRGVAGRFDELQQSRNADDFVDQLLAFRQPLDAEEDVFFVRATAEDLNLQKDKVIARAQDAMNQARTLWEEYQSKGVIDASQRIETSISDQFRSRAQLLAEASRYARQSFLIYSQVDSAGAAQWTAIRDEIESEARQQRSRLRDLSNVVEPELLRAKLALLGEPDQ
jgi:pSer/pThr/pTyr-binding forkhead associated (FHA) protein